MSKSILQLKDQRAIITEQAEAFITSAQTEKRKLTDEENTSFQELTVQISNLNKEITLAETRAVEQMKSNKVTEIKTEKRMKKVSLLKMIEARANGRNLNAEELALVTLGKEELRKSGLTASGDICLPTEYRANIVAGVDATGQDFISEDKAGLIAPIREKLVLVEAGATFLSGLVGDVSIPSYGGTSAA